MTTRAPGSACNVPPIPSAPFSAFVFKTIVDPFAGKLTVLRIVSGHARGDLNVVNSYREGKERLGHLLRLEGKKQVQIPQAVAGDVIALAKLKDTHSGDTLCDERQPVVSTRRCPTRPPSSPSRSSRRARRTTTRSCRRSIG